MEPKRTSDDEKDFAVGSNEYAQLGVHKLEETTQTPASDEWLPRGEVAREAGIKSGSLGKILTTVRSVYPEWVQAGKDEDGNKVDFVSPELRKIILEEYSDRVPAPEGWMTAGALGLELGRVGPSVQRVAEKHLETHSQWSQEFTGSTRNVRTFYAPELIKLIREELGPRQLAPEGWLSINQLAGEVGKDRSTVERLTKDYQEAHPDFFRKYDSHGKSTQYISPELVSIIKEKFSTIGEPPEGWATIAGLVRNLSGEAKKDWRRVKGVAERYRAEHPDDFKTFAQKGVAPTEYISPTLQSLISKELTPEVGPAPEGWTPSTDLIKSLSIPKQTVRKAAERHRSDHPDWFANYLVRGRVVEHYSEELAEKISQELSQQRQKPPDGWQTFAQLKEELQIGATALRTRIDTLVDDNPGWTQTFMNETDHLASYFSPALIRQVSDEFIIYGDAPEGWLNMGQVVSELGWSRDVLKSILDQYREEYPGEIRVFKSKRGSPSEFYHPHLISLMEQQLPRKELAPEGWLTANDFRRKYGNSHDIQSAIEVELQDHPEWAAQYLSSKGMISLHYSPEMAKAIEIVRSQVLDAPEGWMTNRTFCDAIGRAQSMTQRLADTFREDHPEWFQLYRSPQGRAFEYYSPELMEQIQALISTGGEERTMRTEQQKLGEDLRGFLIDVGQGDSSEAQEFRKLTELFGSERAIDILFQHRPEYKSIPLPEVRSILGDYLGEFLVVRGEFNLETLKTSQEYLSNPTLKEGLTEVVKRDVLRFYNTAKRANPEIDDQEVLVGYIRYLRKEARELDSADFNEVLNETESYYRALFEDIHKPDSLIEQIKGDRLFPDINQRINILELAAQNKLLIADEMGLGKSASAIIAKETLGVKQALVVVPSNVVEVWQTYLSDEQTAEGEAKGYFKPGQAPRVLTVNDYEELKAANPEDYDYVILAQERLTAKYVQEMERFDYDMLVVDEAHKLKNIATGKRAENLVRLSQKINGAEDKYLALLSGTPVPNKVGDVAMVLKLLYPERFEKIPDSELTNQILDGDVLDLRSLLLPRMQMKELGESVEMPNLSQEVHSVELSQQEQDVYEVLLEEDELTPTQKMQILRQFILNPRLLDATPDIPGSKATDVGEQLRKTFAGKNKVVLFVNGYVEGVMRGERTIFEDMELPPGVAISRIDGSVDRFERMIIQRELQQPDRRMLLVVSGQTADVGVDFSAADEVAFYNEPWTEYDKRQQLHRVYRPGLQGDLTSHTFVAKGTIEEGIHEYIQTKYTAVEKLLRGIPISELEQELLREDEKQADPNVEVNPELARYYFSSWDNMMRIYGHVRELGEEGFVEFLSRYGETYANSYVDAGSRSYQANANRLSGTLIDRFAKERGQAPEEVRIVDLASGPEMLRRHIPDDYADSVVSVDINASHFAEQDERRVVGSFLQVPLEDKSVDYANLALALHYTSFVPSKGNYERVEALKEMNRVLTNGGRGVVSLMHTSDFRDIEGFRGAVQKLGFRVVDEYSGEVESGVNFKTRVITLEKVADCTEDSRELVRSLGPSGIKGFKFSKKDSTMRDSRRIVTDFSFAGADVHIPAEFNQTDQQVLEEERQTLAQMEELKNQHGLIEAIPTEEIVQRGFARIFNGRRYVLFKRLLAGPGAVVVR